MRFFQRVQMLWIHLLARLRGKNIECWVLLFREAGQQPVFLAEIYADESDAHDAAIDRVVNYQWSRGALNDPAGVSSQYALLRKSDISTETLDKLMRVA